MREAWLGRQLEGSAHAVPATASFGHKRAPFSLVVDLAEDIGSNLWWRGAATLTAMTLALGLLAPGLEPLPSRKSDSLPRAIPEQWQGGRIGTLASGSHSGIRMAPGRSVEAIAIVPERAQVETRLVTGKDGIGPALIRAGATYADSSAVPAMIRAAAVPLAPGTPVRLTLGRREAGRRSVERIAFRSGIDLRVVIDRSSGALALSKIALKVDEKPLRLRGVAGDGLYWALRNSGASASTAADYLKALAQEIDVGEIGAEDRFDLVFANRRTSDGQGKAGMLLYAAIDRATASDLQLVRWTAGGKPVWINVATIGQRHEQDNAMAWPVDAPITSRFGLRVHPILRFARMHRGIDFGARWGTAIHAAADGQVARAGWAGGYGRQVRLNHGDGMATSYSHMSSMAVEPGAYVHRGDVIGYVGTSGLSTGAHLHYEVYRGGVAVDPLSVRFVTSRPIDPATVAAIRARVKQLLG